MRLPAAQGLGVLFVLADQWRRERQLLAALGVEDPGADELLADAGDAGRLDRAERIEAMGGEVMAP